MAAARYKAPTAVDRYDGESASGTEFRRLLHNMLNNPLLPEEGKAFLITSATTAEGKSTIASSLAITASVYKMRKTLLLDADLRRPAVHKLFCTERGGGLSDILIGDANFEDCPKSTQLENLWLLTSGTHHDDPTQLLESQKLADLLAATRFYFDLIVVDCAPVIPVSDALLLAKEVDGVVMVVKAGETPKEVGKRACDLVREAGGNLLGATLNNVKEALPYYYNYRYYGYRYSAEQ